MNSKTFDCRKGFQVDPDAKPGSIHIKSPAIDYGTAPRPPDRYLSREFAQLEWDRMWRKVWFYAGLVCDVPEIGDYFKVDLGHESFIVVRTSATRLRAYYNVCQHRGNRLVTADFGHVSNCFQCAFHGWEYGTDGALVKILDEELFRPEAIADRPGLTEVACDIWNGFVFLSMNPKPEPLLDFLGVVPQHLKHYPIDQMRVLRDLEFDWGANWKTAMDAFLEFYHAEIVHPEILPITDSYAVQYDLYDKGIGRMLIENGNGHPRWPDRENVNEAQKMFLGLYDGKHADYAHLKGREYKKAIADAKRKWCRHQGYTHIDYLNDDQMVDDWNYFLFPNVTLNVFADGCLLQSWRPHPTDPDQSHYVAVTLALPVRDPQARPFDINEFGPVMNTPKGWTGEPRAPRGYPKDFDGFGYVLAQDARIVPDVQKGIRSAGFKGLRYNESECRIPHYHAEIDRYLRGEK
jgi:carnitine monooxygenase subunit